MDKGLQELWPVRIFWETCKSSCCSSYTFLCINTVIWEEHFVQWLVKRKVTLSPKHLKWTQKQFKIELIKVSLFLYFNFILGKQWRTTFVHWVWNNAMKELIWFELALSCAHSVFFLRACTALKSKHSPKDQTGFLLHIFVVSCRHFSGKPSCSDLFKPKVCI